MMHSSLHRASDRRAYHKTATFLLRFQPVLSSCLRLCTRPRHAARADLSVTAAGGADLWRIRQPTPPSSVPYPEQVSTARGDVEGTQIRIAEGAVGGPVHRHRVGLQNAARRRKDVD